MLVYDVVIAQTKYEGNKIQTFLNMINFIYPLFSTVHMLHLALLLASKQLHVCKLHIKHFKTMCGWYTQGKKII